jgi:hypothetical protein
MGKKQEKAQKNKDVSELPAFAEYLPSVTEIFPGGRDFPLVTYSIDVVWR